MSFDEDFLSLSHSSYPVNVVFLNKTLDKIENKSSIEPSRLSRVYDKKSRKGPIKQRNSSSPNELPKDASSHDGLLSKGQERNPSEDGIQVFYPKKSKLLGEQGDVLLKVHIGKDGLVKSHSIIESSRFQRLNQAAIFSIYNSKLSKAPQEQIRTYRFRYRLRIL